MSKKSFVLKLIALVVIIALLAFAGAKLYQMLLNFLGIVRNEGNMTRTVVFADPDPVVDVLSDAELIQ